MSSKGFDEYGNYGENNPPVGDTEFYTDKEPFALGLERVKEHEDGSADYKIHMSDEAKESIFDYGLQFILYCAASKMDIQDALELILKQGDSDG